MAIVSSDFHGNVKKLHNFLNYKPEVQHIFAGDAVDSYGEPYENQLKCLKELYESDCILIYGNHELSYHPIYRMSCSGKHDYGLEYFTQYIYNEAFPNRWRAAYVANDYLITHAGLCEDYVGKATTVTGKATSLNKQFKRKDQSMYYVGRSRGGWKTNGGIFWYDFRYDYGGLSTRFNQVFGHCSLKEPWEEKTNTYHHVCINSLDTIDDTWVFDTEEKRIVILK